MFPCIPYDAGGQTTMSEHNQITRKLTIRQATEMFPVSESWLRHKIMNREIPFIKIGRKTLIDAETFNQFLDAHVVAPRGVKQ